MSGVGDDLFGGGDRSDGPDDGGGGGDGRGRLGGLLASLEGRASRRAGRHGAAALPEELDDGGAGGGEELDDGGAGGGDESAAARPGDRIVELADTVR